MKKYLIVLFSFLIIPALSSVAAQDSQVQGITIFSVRNLVTEAKRGDVFETRLTVSQETPDVATNLLINGKEYFAPGGGGACRSDGDLFIGWDTSGENPTVRILCTIPRNVPSGATIEVVGFRFRNCDGPVQEDKTVRCNVKKSTTPIKLIDDPAKDSTATDSARVTDSAQATNSAGLGDDGDSIVKRLLDVFFRRGDLSTGGNNAGNGNGDGNTGGGDTGGGDTGGGSTRPISAEIRQLSSCIAGKMSAEVQARYNEHLPYILAEAKVQQLSAPQTAYVLATARHETGHFKYLTEIGDDGYFAMYEREPVRTWVCNVVSGDGPKFKGRGYVQLTGRCNYLKFTHKPLRYEDPALSRVPSLRGKYDSYADYSDVLSKRINLLVTPESIIQDFQGAGAVIVKGHKEGIFTGARLDTYVNGAKKDYVGARAVINGADKATQIAAYATEFERFLGQCSAN
jgi:hypothetical protein